MAESWTTFNLSSQIQNKYKPEGSELVKYVARKIQSV
jgi:hypothetical protein